MNDAAAGADILLQPWKLLAMQLSPLIGDNGFCALYGRAARLVSVRTAQAVPAFSGKTIAGLLAALHAHFAVADALDAAGANAALLTTFTKLLAGLIGEALTKQLLDAAPAVEGAWMPVQEPLA